MNQKPFLSRLADAFMAGFAALIIMATITVVTVNAAPTLVSRVFGGVTKFTGATLYSPAGTLNSDTNGFQKCFSPNGTNYWAEMTNGQRVYYTAVGTFTGMMARVVFTNGSAATRLTNDYIDGKLVQTNGGAFPTTPL